MAELEFKGVPPEGFWDGFQQHMGYTDEQVKAFKADPRKFKFAPRLASDYVRNKTLIMEVVAAHSCPESMKPGDKLYFTGLSMLDPTRSSRWCAYALTYAITLAFACHNLILQGLDPNDLYGNTFSCWDCGTKYGWGDIVMKAYVITEPTN